MVSLLRGFVIVTVVEKMALGKSNAAFGRRTAPLAEGQLYMMIVLIDGLP
jgi:hypothetical protein